MRWQDLAQNVPGDLLSKPAAEGEWSAVQCLQHLLDTEAVFAMRIKAFLAGQDFPGFNPNTQSGQPSNNFAEMAANFAASRLQNLELLGTLTVEDLPRKARHSELGVVTLEELLHEWAAHDLMHTVQGERALMQPFIQGSGPWISFFADHDIRLKQKS
jgi:hypothetical protein